MEFIFHIYGYEWRSYRDASASQQPVPGGDLAFPPSRQQIENWLSLIRQCGFTMISIDELLEAWKGDHWAFYYNTLIDGKPFIDYILEAGFEVELRLWAMFSSGDLPPVNGNPLTPTRRRTTRPRASDVKSEARNGMNT